MMTGDLILNLSRVEHSHHNHHAPTHRTHFHSDSRSQARAELSHRHNSTPDTGLHGDHANKLYVYLFTVALSN
ncbi:unnamed protein product [Leptidea sinapis]|uniref:Uncharacterized protein n=1 Tax=Leptidea sinapis TaxID=189913 RepID=A0A5E4R0P0_9NEOP|nr:unnamed protein product [Leptidea sinapis]